MIASLANASPTKYHNHLGSFKKQSASAQSLRDSDLIGLETWTAVFARLHGVHNIVTELRTSSPELEIQKTMHPSLCLVTDPVSLANF